MVPPKEMTQIHDEINRPNYYERMLANSLISPHLEEVDLDFMEQHGEALHVDDWKCYTGSPLKGFEHAWISK